MKQQLYVALCQLILLSFSQHTPASVLAVHSFSRTGTAESVPSLLSSSSQTVTSPLLSRDLPARANNNDPLTARTFSIDYVNNTLLKDGRPFRYLAGSVHYFRVPRAYWSDRLWRLRSMGVNILQMYVEWSSHEPENNMYDFHYQNDLLTYIHEAQRHDLLVILRPGPYIDAERDMGGLPYWLLSYRANMTLRSMDADYLHFVDRWFDKLLPMVKPMLYEHGGPIIMVQVENEYGSYYTCDLRYTSHLKHKIRQHLGPNVLLFSTDGANVDLLRCGKSADVFATVDFGPGSNVRAAFAAQRLVEPHGPLINSEFYPGWLDHWGYPHSRRNTSEVLNSLHEQLRLGANVNLYVAHGGTSFGFGAGADLSATGQYQPCPTSYDYDAPITENGVMTTKYWAIRNASRPLTGRAPDPPPQPAVRAYGSVQLTHAASVFQLVDELDAVISQRPLTFEQLQQSSGYVLYEHRVTEQMPDPARLQIAGLRDRGYVYVDDRLQGVLSRAENVYEMPLRVKRGQKLRVLVENQGRVCFGRHINDIKGITSQVLLDGRELLLWNHTSLPLNTTQLSQINYLLDQPAAQLSTSRGDRARGGDWPPLPAMFSGEFNINQSSADTFLRVDGWGRGVAFINGFNLGRYWPSQGPQVTLYVPSTALRESNQLLLLELETVGCSPTSPSLHETNSQPLSSTSNKCGYQETVSCSVTFTSTHVLDGPTPYK